MARQFITATAMGREESGVGLLKMLSGRGVMPTDFTAESIAEGSDVSRTLALAVRLFGNIVSGEILFGVLLTLVPFLLPLPLMFLSLITGTIQAYIFAVLAIVYIGGAVQVVEKQEGKETVQ